MFKCPSIQDFITELIEQIFNNPFFKEHQRETYKKLEEIWDNLKYIENISDPEKQESISSHIKNFTEESDDGYSELNVMQI